MQEITKSIQELLAPCKTLRAKIIMLAESAGIDTSTRPGIEIPHDLLELRSGTNFDEISYTGFITMMMLIMVRSYMDKDDTSLVPVIDKCFNKHFKKMEVSEKLFYLLLKFRLGEVVFSSR